MKTMIYHLHKAARRKRDSGSGLLLVLMLTLVLSFLGITLLGLSELEMRLGGFERVQAGTFYAAEAGTSIASARILTGAVAPTTFLMPDFDGDPSASTSFRIGYSVGLSRSIAVTQSPCDFCSANEDGESWSNKVTYLVHSRATRRDWRSVDPDSPVPVDQAPIQAEKTISVTFQFQPAELPRIDSIPTAEEAALVEL